MGKISKTFKKVVLSAIAVIGLTGVFFGTTFSAFRNHPVEAVVEDESAIYDFKYENNELKLLFNANLAAYKKLDKSFVSQLRSDLMELAQDVVFDDIQLTGEKQQASPQGLRRTFRLPGGLGNTTGVDTSLLEKLIKTQLSDQESIENYLAQSGEGGSYDTLTQLYVERYAESYAAQTGADVDEVKDDIKNAVAEAAQAQVNEVYEAIGQDAPDVKSNIEASVEATQEAGYEVNVAISDVSDVLNIISSAIEADDSITVTDIMDQFTYVDGDTGEKVVTIKNDIVDTLTDATQDNYIDDVVDLLKTVDSSVVSEVINKVGFTNDDMVSVIETIGTGKLVEIADQIGSDGIKEIFDGVDGIDKDAIIDVIKTNVTLKDLLKAIKVVSVDGEAIYDQDNGGVRGRAIVNILKKLPRPHEIRNWTDDSQARLSYDIVITTSFGDVEFKLTVGLFGNVKFIADLAGIIDDAIEISYADGAVNVVVKAPQAVSSLVKRIVETDAISDDLKHWAYDLIFSTVEDAYNEIHGKTLGEYIELLKGVDYEKFVGAAMNADNWNSKFNTNKFTNERIDKLVNGAFKLISIAASKDYETFKNYAEKLVPSYDERDSKIEKVYNKIKSILEKIDARDLSAEKIRQFADANDDTYTNDDVYAFIDKLANYENYFNRAQNLLERLYNNVIPENLKSKSIMDYYVNDNGERSFKVSGDVTLNIEKLIKEITPTYGDRIINALSSILDRVPEDITFNFEAKFTGLYKITYNIGDTQKVGLLPDGADVAFFANCEEFEGQDIVKWIYEDGTEVEGMPADDTEVYAVFDFEVNDNEAVEKVYLEEGTVVATTNPEELQWDSYYELYKENGDADEFIAGADDGIFDISNFKVADSGDYYIVVTEYGPADGSCEVLVREGDPFKITITKAEVEEPTLVKDSFEYNGTEQSVALNPESELYAISNNKQTNAGSYKATVALADKDNYQWKNAKNSDDLQLAWKITPKLIDKPVAPQPNEFEYNHGADIVYNIPANDLYTITNNKAQDVGDYEAVVALKDKKNYAWADGTTDNLKFAFKIKPFEVAKPAQGTNKFTYDGQEKTYAIAASDYYEVEGNKATNAGEYEATIRLINKNYAWKDTNGDKAPLSYAWTIDPMKVNKPATQGASYPYTGNEITYQFAGAEYVTIFGDKGTEPGQYVAVIMLKNGNYVWSDGTEDPISVTWTITKAQINVPAIAWNYTAPFTYDGQEHEVKLSTQLGDNIVVTYQGNKATEVGDYVATATLAPADPTHYEIDPSKVTYVLQWKIESGEEPITYNKNFDSVEKDGQGRPYANVKINDGDGVRSDYTLHSPAMDENSNFWSNVDFDAFFDQTEKDGGYIVHAAYDIHFQDTNGATQAVSGSFTVRMMIPEDLRDNNNLIVLHIADDGTIEEIESERDGIYMQFNTTHFSVYAIAERTAAANVPIWPFIVIIALLVVIIILQVIILLRNKAVAAAPAQEEKAEEEPKEEEKPEEEPQPEPQPEPEPEPEPEQEPEEEPEAEDEDTGDDEDEEEEEEEEPAVEGEPVLKKKRKKMVHFQTKLARSEKDLRHKYYDLRDYIKSYGINNRISIPCDTFSLHRKRYVVITIAGKRLKIYLATDPSKYEGTPIPAEPTKLKKYEDLPTMFKVKSDLSVKRAKAMVDEIMAAEGYERKE